MRLPMPLVRVGGVAAAVVIAVTGVATAASAATTGIAGPSGAAGTTVHPVVVHRIPTRLAIHATRPVAHAHQTTATVYGHLTARRLDLRHLRVWLQRLGAKGRWYVVGSKLTRPFGHVFFRVHAGAKPGVFRLVFRGTRRLAPALSRLREISPATGS